MLIVCVCIASVACLDAASLKEVGINSGISKDRGVTTQNSPFLPRAIVGGVSKGIGLHRSQAVSTDLTQRATDALRVCNAAKHGDLEVRHNSRLLDGTVPSEECREFLTPVDRGDKIALRLSSSGQGGEVQAVASEVVDEPILYLIGTPVGGAACGKACLENGRKNSYLIHQFYARHDGLQTAQLGFMDAQAGAAAAELLLRGEVEVPSMKDGGIRHISPGSYKAIIRSTESEVSETIRVEQGECYVILRSESGKFMVFPDSRPLKLKSSCRVNAPAISLLSFFVIALLSKLM